MSSLRPDTAHLSFDAPAGQKQDRLASQRPPRFMPPTPLRILPQPSGRAEQNAWHEVIAPPAGSALLLLTGFVEQVFEGNAQDARDQPQVEDRDVAFAAFHGADEGGVQAALLRQLSLEPVSIAVTLI